MRMVKFLNFRKDKKDKKLLNYFFIILLQGVVFAPLTSIEYTNDILSKRESEIPFIDEIKAEDIDAIRTLIELGKDLNGWCKGGYTPLMAAVTKGNIEIINLFIASGADVSCCDYLGNNLLMYAFYCDKEMSEVVDLLLNLDLDTEIMNSDEITPLMLAAMNDYCSSVEKLIKAGATTEIIGDKGNTALAFACLNNSVESARILIESGADIEAKNDSSHTPLMHAACENSGPIIRLLLDANAAVNTVTTRESSVWIQTGWFSFSGETIHFPEGSNALDIAKKFENRCAEYVLLRYGYTHSSSLDSQVESI